MNFSIPWELGRLLKNCPEALKEVTAPIPPLPEQRRIVGILDKAFAAIATAKEDAERT
ncbi:MAG: restriction endonuclease subunit S [Planctomycetales bacterium]